MDRTKDAYRHQSNNRVIMWYKIRELYSKGFNKTQIAFQLGLHKKYGAPVLENGRGHIDCKIAASQAISPHT